MRMKSGDVFTLLVWNDDSLLLDSRPTNKARCFLWDSLRSRTDSPSNLRLKNRLEVALTECLFQQVDGLSNLF